MGPMWSGTAAITIGPSHYPPAKLDLLWEQEIWSSESLVTEIGLIWVYRSLRLVILNIWWVKAVLCSSQEPFVESLGQSWGLWEPVVEAL